MKQLFITASAMMALAGVAQAAPVTVAGLTFDDSAFVDTALAVQGTFDASGVIGGDFSTGVDVQEPAGSIMRVAQLGFSDNTLVNGAGNDLALFVPSYVFNLGVATDFPGPVGGPSPFQGRNGISSDGGMIAYLYDLSDYGIADGASISSFFITRFGDVEAFTFAAAALNGKPIVDPPVAVPLPGAGALVLSGLAGLAMVSRRRRSHKQTDN